MVVLFDFGVCMICVNCDCCYCIFIGVDCFG